MKNDWYLLRLNTYNLKSVYYRPIAMCNLYLHQLNRGIYYLFQCSKKKIFQRSTCSSNTELISNKMFGMFGLSFCVFFMFFFSFFFFFLYIIYVMHWFPNWGRAPLGACTHCWGGTSIYYKIQFLFNYYYY